MRRILLGIGAALSLGFALLPLVWTAIVSLAEHPDFLLRGGLSPTFDNYRDLFTSEDLHFADYLKNSLLISSLSALLSLIASFLCAYALSRLSPFKALPLLLGVLGISLFPQISSAGFLYRIFSLTGLINTYPALVLPYTAWSLPLGVWLMHAYISSLPRDIDRSALVDGAGRLTILLRIVLPLSLPGLASTYVLLFLFCFNEFLFALMFTVDYRARTVPVGIALFEGLHGQIPWGHITAASLVSVLPVLILVLFLQSYIIRGLTGGAVKG